MARKQAESARVAYWLSAEDKHPITLNITSNDGDAKGLALDFLVDLSPFPPYRMIGRISGGPWELWVDDGKRAG